MCHIPYDTDTCRHLGWGGMHKDTAKLLLGLVPVLTVVGIALALAPRFDAIRADGVWRWANAHLAVDIGVVATMLGVLGVVAACSYVLLAAPGTWRDLRSNVDWFSKAFSDHAVGLPYFLDSTAFTSAESKIAQSDTGVTGDDREAVAKVRERTLELSERLEAARRFNRFTWAYLACIVAIVGGAGTVLATLPAASGPITAPVIVQLHLPATAEAGFVHGTHCRASKTTTAVAVGGFWNDPELRLYGPGCDPAKWLPTHSKLDVVITPKVGA
jgi:hypothetical protein